MNVLIVDDNETNRKLLRVLLEGHQIETTEAADGQEALDLLEREPIDVMVSDVLMPNMDGFQLCYEVRHKPPLAHVGVILYTATDFTLEDERRAFDLGADRFLKKHGSTSAILTAIRETSEEIKAAAPRHVPVFHDYPELQVMKEYNQTMIYKLEQKSVALEAAQLELQKANELLEERVRKRTAELEAVNKELESFSYSVSHDLRAPLRWITANSAFLESDCGLELNAKGKKYLSDIQHGCDRMSQLIEDLLALARVTRRELRLKEVDLSAMATDVVAKLRATEPEGDAEITIAAGMVTQGDQSLLRLVLENLLHNAWKYSGKAGCRRIEFGQEDKDGCHAYFVRDNGVGFDMTYAGKLFGAFQRLHSQDEFPGTGVGLATVQRILHRHGGRIWAESRKGQGATFHFTVSATGLR